MKGSLYTSFISKINFTDFRLNALIGKVSFLTEVGIHAKSLSLFSFIKLAMNIGGSAQRVFPPRNV